MLGGCVWLLCAVALGDVVSLGSFLWVGRVGCVLGPFGSVSVFCCVVVVLLLLLFGGCVPVVVVVGVCVGGLASHLS